MTKIRLNGKELIAIAALATCAMNAMARDACSVLTKGELSELMGTKIEWAGTAGGKVPSGATACSYTSGQEPGLPGALVEVSEAQGEALMANCRGAAALSGLGDRACLQSTPYSTMVTAVKGKAGVMITLFNASKITDPKSVAKKIAQTVLGRF